MRASVTSFYSQWILLQLEKEKKLTRHNLTGNRVTCFLKHGQQNTDCVWIWQNYRKRNADDNQRSVQIHILYTLLPINMASRCRPSYLYTYSRKCVAGTTQQGGGGTRRSAASRKSGWWKIRGGVMHMTNYRYTVGRAHNKSRHFTSFQKLNKKETDEEPKTWATKCKTFYLVYFCQNPQYVPFMFDKPTIQRLGWTIKPKHTQI